jgi:hypothetical protein
MKHPRRPAAYCRVPAAAGRLAMTAAARQRGWPAPAVYADADGDGTGAGGSWQALDRLAAAIITGRHDGLLLGVAADPVPLMWLLLQCTRNGVTVSFEPPPPAAGGGLRSAGGTAGPGLDALLAAVTAALHDQPCRPAEVVAAPAARQAREPWDVLARARLEALAGLFPAWRIWLDNNGWHARRRSDGYVQGYRPGAPAFHVSADSAIDLAAQLCWQRAADEHVPDGCQSAIASPPPWGGLAAGMQPAM